MGPHEQAPQYPWGSQMRELLDQIDLWHQQGKQVALATVVSVEGSTPRGVGAKMAMTPEREFVGSVSGGCVEADVFEHALQVIESGTPRVVEYGFTGDMAFEIGLACGGAMRVSIERLSTMHYCSLAQAIRAQEPVVEVTVIGAPATLGAKMLIFQDGSKQGSLGLGQLDARVEEDARGALSMSRSRTRRYPLDSGVLGCDAPDGEQMVELFVESHVPPATLVIIGAGHVSIALASMASLIGYRVIVIDARSAFATRERFPHAAEIIVAWPHEALIGRPIGPTTSVAVLTHDPKFEEPLLPVLLSSSAAYVGVIGSRRTHAQRRERLQALGFSDRDLQRLSGPIGLDIGADTPEEIALSILAEIVATRHGRVGGPLSALAGTRS